MIAKPYGQVSVFHVNYYKEVAMDKSREDLKSQTQWLDTFCRCQPLPRSGFMAKCLDTHAGVNHYIEMTITKLREVACKIVRHPF